MQLRVIGHGPHPPGLAFSYVPWYLSKVGNATESAVADNRYNDTSHHLMRHPTLTSKNFSTTQHSFERTPRHQLCLFYPYTTYTSATIREFAMPRDTVAARPVTKKDTSKTHAAPTREVELA